MSNFAFGTYRISDLNPQHIEALKEAIDSGIKLIDTSTNYMDGGAERAIALALRSFDEDVRNNVEIVSKFGYIQNTTLQRDKETSFEDVVKYSENCHHSIAKSFLQDQLSLSLKRLEVKKIDCYLIHNPEYYLLDAINKGIDEDERLDEMYRRIEDCFIALEEEVIAGRIGSYGISSNSFAKATNDIEFLPYEDLVTLAKNAANYLGLTKHNFTTLELPINLLEREGLKCAKWAHESNLRVLVNRPLNAMKDSLMLRLATYEESREYYHHFNELIEVCESNKKLEALSTLLEQLDDNKHKFGWLGDYDSFLFTQIIPHIKQTLETIDEANAEVMLNFIDMFLQEYRKMVAFECSKSTRIVLKEFVKESEKRLQDIALEFLLSCKDIDYILVGMRKPSYVHEVMNIKIKS
jgi:aryl-alcohol dehydrogenase-like predicted oxidoreductase